MINLYHSELLNPLVGPHRWKVALCERQCSFNNTGQPFSKKQTAVYRVIRKGFRVNDIVLITLPPGEEFLVIIYAIAMLRGRVAIIDPEMGRINFAAKLRQLLQNGRLWIRDYYFSGDPFPDYWLYKIK